MSAVYLVADNIYSPIGKTTAENFSQLKNGSSGIKLHDDKKKTELPFYASLFEDQASLKTINKNYTFFEALLIASINDALKYTDINIDDPKTALIISSTKGNISLLETEENNAALQKRISLADSARLIAAHFGFQIEPLVVSNACISGIVAIITGMRLIQSGVYENVVVAGADVITKFILSGFQAFNAISAKPCKPFDLNRDGITLGEAAATIVLSAKPQGEDSIKVLGGAVSNDASHISAPSRTGEELAFAIKKSLEQAQLKADEIDFVSAHGTATVYNDEMEAKAITLANLQNAPVNSLKGYFGHTLGAAGLIESIISIQSLKENLFIPTLGFDEIGVSTAININRELLAAEFKNCLKTASGFGGCNAAIVFGKA